MNKPKFYESGRCSFCHSEDVVIMITEDCYVLWCSCGSVEICEKGEVKQVYKFE